MKRSQFNCYGIRDSVGYLRSSSFTIKIIKFGPLKFFFCFVFLLFCSKYFFYGHDTTDNQYYLFLKIQCLVRKYRKNTMVHYIVTLQSFFQCKEGTNSKFTCGNGELIKVEFLLSVKIPV